MRTLDESIKYCEEKAEALREYSDVLSETSTTPKGKEISDCLECAEEHEQLAKWLSHYQKICRIVEEYSKRDEYMTMTAYFVDILETFKRGDEE